jgi:hypothetical protein
MKIIKYELIEKFGIFVEYRAENSWVVKYNSMNLSKDGIWEYESMSSSRSNEFYQKSNFRFSSPEEAEQTFLKYKDNLRINGKNISEWEQWHEARKKKS